MTPLIKLENICYQYPAATEPAIRDINLSLGQGRTGIIGPNGGGKTTLFHLIVGLLKPTEGRLLFQGREVSCKKDLYQLRKEVGFLFQNSDDQLFSPTVLEDVAFGPLNLGAGPEEAREVAQNTLEGLGLYGFEERITHRLSGGEKKLVALATILAMKPKILLLDEPTNNLDPRTQDRLVEILNGLAQSQLIISHDLDFLDSVTEELYTVEEGRINLCPAGHIHEHRHIHQAGNQPHRHEKSPLPNG
ncbi:energy-coupling factor ABC transporter ATP-binding protein [Desulfotalea psychrophila]|uniref:Probable ABC transporter, ATP-binding protein n=1 Tax=Desulfotalea psychrophila (strain LSv54 / DSM 12343) TaxID=177439 RepID=Q6AQ88_DESPS|nr:ABC transporter ATP-binding protein [Desulfotalea psychrophila]CAG35485.1 probable ABC transporter, ATP-binding protein [Desulfotalea psychrophila LSv54]